MSYNANIKVDNGDLYINQDNTWTYLYSVPYTGTSSGYVKIAHGGNHTIPNGCLEGGSGSPVTDGQGTTGMTLSEFPQFTFSKVDAANQTQYATLWFNTLQSGKAVITFVNETDKSIWATWSIADNYGDGQLPVTLLSYSSNVNPATMTMADMGIGYIHIISKIK